MIDVILYNKDYNNIIDLPFVAKTILNNKNSNIIFWAPDEIDTWQRVKAYKDKINKLCASADSTIEFWEGNLLPYKTYKQDRITVINWQNFCVHYTLGKYKIKNEHNKTQQMQNLFVSLNRSSVLHKCVFIDLLAKHNCIDNNLVTWHDINNNNYNFKYFDNQKLILDDISSGVEIVNYPDYYCNAFLDLVCESFDNFPDISEKTYKAIAAKKPFITIGYKGLYAELQNLGFKLYNELFDYEFDNLVSFQDRAEHVIKQVKNLQNQNLNTLKKQIEQKLEYNYNVLLNLAKTADKQIINFANKHTVPHYSDILDYVKRDRHHHNFVL